MYPVRVQDRFVGDIGDFGKYGLLRALTGLWDWKRGGPLPEHKRLSLGVVWYRNDTDTRSGDGKYINYLNKLNKLDEYKPCDPKLFDCLASTIRTNERKISSIEQAGILGGNTVYYDKMKDWMNDAESLERIQEQRIIFLDPDNGLATPTMERKREYSPKHVHIKEIDSFLQYEQTVVIYHHLGRTGLEEGRNCHSLQMRDWAKRINDELSPPVFPRVLWYRRGTARAFFILPARQHSTDIDARLSRMLDGPWACHFTQLML